MTSSSQTISDSPPTSRRRRIAIVALAILLAAAFAGVLYNILSPKDYIVLPTYTRRTLSHNNPYELPPFLIFINKNGDIKLKGKEHPNYIEGVLWSFIAKYGLWKYYPKYLPQLYNNHWIDKKGRVQLAGEKYTEEELNNSVKNWLMFNEPRFVVFIDNNAYPQRVNLIIEILRKEIAGYIERNHLQMIPPENADKGIIMARRDGGELVLVRLDRLDDRNP